MAALVTTKEVFEYLDITSTSNESEEIMSALIDRLSTDFENYIGYSIASAERTQYYDGSGTSFLFLDNIPVTSVSSIYDDTDWEWESTSLLASADYRIADERYVYYSGYFSEAHQNIKITYTAGYSSTPEDLKQSVIEEVGRKFKNRNDYDVTTKSLADGSVTYTDLEYLPLTIKVLERYKRKAFI